MSSIAARRRHPAALLVVLLLGLVMVGGLYAVFAPKSADASAASAGAVASEDKVSQGKQLFLANCASCHGSAAAGGPNGPSLVGVGAAAVDFQVGTGRMPMQQPGVQAGRNMPQMDPKQTAALAAYVASLGDGPGVPSKQYTEGGGNVAKGGELFRVNCAMCHNFAGSGGALTRGKYAPSLMNVSGKHMYEAMVTGPQSMPVFNDSNLSPQDKQDIISFLKYLESEPAQGGHNMGSLGPVADGLFAWTIFIGLLIGAAVWLGKKAA
ncbi:c-type cytochrome [Yimella sp. cx-51]|uniref:cytochrome bc1 complex diheme cytochrome c subunit n=1 Tax=Yimella sp. cx-51 TaxID=2770551 RepID=UPI00165DCF06|nr:c-type cytochrome [Yimella sp. cx-51]MBC9957597.1 c-type cytochrome [Yimella sp. cx-51]MBD2758639.1 c-type cytochrome [Yimella sp. cx-573]QTH37042.1 c-type cytochrome [Yimella sp. cx-51]